MNMKQILLFRLPLGSWRAASQLQLILEMEARMNQWTEDQATLGSQILTRSSTANNLDDIE
ncbi:hypothetical protein LINPERPRIM_LOCUS27983 [Linum perenne]